MKLFWILLLSPFSLLAQPDNIKTQVFTFRLMTMDDFLTTRPENGGQAVYKHDSTGMKIDGEIEINPSGKFVKITYTADKKHPMKAFIGGAPAFDAQSGCNRYEGQWDDSQEKTEITTIGGDQVKIIRVMFGPHKGDHSDYWDRICQYYVTKKG